MILPPLGKKKGKTGMKKKILMLTASSVLLSAAFVGATAGAASTAEVSNSKNAEITITVTDRAQGERINIIVADKDTPISALEEDVTKLVHQASFISNGSGSDIYVFRLNLPENFETGEYKAYISGEEEPCNIYYIQFDHVVSIAKKITSETNEADLATLLAENQKELSLSNPLFENASCSSIAKKLIAEQKKNPISFDSEENAVVELQRRIKEFACLSCFENGKRDILFKDGLYLYNDIVNLDTIDNADVTINKICKEVLSDAGKNEVLNGIFNKPVSDVQDLQQLYSKNVLLNAIKNSNYEGYGYISDVLTEGNADFAGLSIDKYLNYSNKLSASRNIASGKSSLTIENMEAKINDSINSTSGTSGNSGGSGGGGSGSSMPSGRPVVAQTPTEQSENSGEIFADMKGHWASEAVEYLYKNKIVNGYSDNSFAPDNNLKIEEACKILAIAFDKTSETELKFVDVNKSDWFYGYVAALTDCGAIRGISDTEFGTGRIVTREEFATMMYRLLGEKKSDKTAEFGDSSEISDWAADAVNALVGDGIINGFEDNTFRPQEKLTRAQAAKLIYSVIK